MFSPVFRTAYDGVDDRSSDIDFGDEPSLTIQSAADECDINLIIDRARRGISPGNVNSSIPTFDDYSELPDFQASMNAVVRANEMFDALPATIRERFANSPAKLLEFVANADNRDEAVRLGIVAAPQARSEPQASETLAGSVEPPVGSV